MLRPRGVLVVLLSAGALAAGCNAILGNDAHELGEAGVDSAVETDGATADGSNPTDSPSEAARGPAGDAGDAGSAGDASDAAGSCVLGDTQCSGSTVQTCDSRGSWRNGAACPYVCSQGQCTGVCVPNATQACGSAATCNSAAMQTCDSTGAWGPCMPGPGTCAAVPAGWQPVATTSAACPSGFDTPSAYISGADGGAPTCACNCTGTQACTGTFTLNRFHPGPGCSGTAAAATVFPVSPTCTTGGFGQVVQGDGYTISNVVYGPGPSCVATPAATATPPVSSQTVSLCAATATCPSGACLSASQAASLCVSKAGTNACPTGFPTRTLVSQAVGDTRGCGPCACGSTLTCTLTGALLDNDYACGTGNTYNFTAATTCTAAPSAYPLNAIQAVETTTGTGTCAQTAPSNPTGAVGLDPATTATVCCP
jgi:hypothetical protein